METQKNKTPWSQTVLNLLLLIVCCSIFGLFIYEYIRKSDELEELKTQEKLVSAEKDIQLKKIKGMADLYRETAYSNVPEGIVPSEDSEKIKEQIAQNVSANLTPILSKVNKDQELTKNKIDKIQNELIKLLNDETKKSMLIRQELARTLKSEREREDKLQKDLTETQKVVSALNGLTSELKAKYLAAHGDDSALSDIGDTAAAPARFVINAFKLDWFEGSDLKKEEQKYNAIQYHIMEYYNAIGNPEELQRIKDERIRRENEYRMKHNNRSRSTEPEILKTK